MLQRLLQQRPGDHHQVRYPLNISLIGRERSYADLTYTVGLNSEEYGVGFRKGSDLAAKLNEFFKSSYKDGTMMKIAETYGVQAAIIEQK